MVNRENGDWIEFDYLQSTWPQRVLTVGGAATIRDESVTAPTIEHVDHVIVFTVFRALDRF
jgi:hypothetical protein